MHEFQNKWLNLRESVDKNSRNKRLLDLINNKILKMSRTSRGSPGRPGRGLCSGPTQDID